MRGALVYNRETGRLCYSVSNESSRRNRLVYKNAVAHVFVSWDSPNRDLDICGYWCGWSAGAVGWSWGDSTKQNEEYWIKWYGDDTTAGGTEHLLLATPITWPELTDHRVRVHLNYYGPSETGKCTVRVVSADGETELTKANVTCAARIWHRAEKTDPYVEILFGEDGEVLQIS